MARAELVGRRARLGGRPCEIARLDIRHRIMSWIRFARQFQVANDARARASERLSRVRPASRPRPCQLVHVHALSPFVTARAPPRSRAASSSTRKSARRRRPRRVARERIHEPYSGGGDSRTSEYSASGSRTAPLGQPILPYSGHTRPRADEHGTAAARDRSSAS